MKAWPGPDFYGDVNASGPGPRFPLWASRNA